MIEKSLLKMIYLFLMMLVVMTTLTMYHINHTVPMEKIRDWGIEQIETLIE